VIIFQLWFLVTGNLAAWGLWRALAAGGDKELRNERLRWWLFAAALWWVMPILLLWRRK